MEWYNNLAEYSKVLFVIAIAFTALLLIQLILLLFGLGTDTDIDMDPSDINSGDFGDVGGLKLFSVRGVTIFCGIFGWVGLLLMETTNLWWLASLIGTICGGLAMFLFAYAMKKMTKLEQEGNIRLSNAIGKIGSVYLKIPANKSGKGKINLVIQETYIEVEAVTEDSEDIIVGSDVEVIEVINNYLLVKKIGGK